MRAAAPPRLRTLRARLTTWYSGLIGVCVVVFSIAVGVLFSGHVHAELDRQVHEDIELAARALTVQPGGAVTWPSGFFAAHVEEEEGGGHWLEVWHAGTRVLGDGSMPAPLLRPPDREQPATTLRHGDGWVRVKTEEVRVGGTTLLVRAALSEESGRRSVTRVWIHLAGFSLVIIALAAVGGHALVGHLLGPLSRMATHARRITAEELHERLPPAPTRELEQLRQAFNETLARLERSFDHLRRFTADASHELRTPLTALRTVGEVALRSSRSAEDYREVIGSMLEEADRLARLADELLTLARMESGAAPLHRERLDVSAVAAEVADQLLVLAEVRGQALQVVADAPAWVSGDRQTIRQALVNLVDNAIKYAPDSSRVGLRTATRDGFVTVDVVDEGPGIAPEHRERVFERFYRVDKSRSREIGGTGLGLSLVKWAAEAHGGRVELESVEGRGSTFRLVLPAIDQR